MFDTIREAVFVGKTPEDLEATRIQHQKRWDREAVTKGRRIYKYDYANSVRERNWKRNKHNIIISRTGHATRHGSEMPYAGRLSKEERKIVLNGTGTVIVRANRPIHSYSGTPFETYQMIVPKFKHAPGTEENEAPGTYHGPTLVYVPRNIPEDLYHDVRRALAMHSRVEEALGGKSKEDKAATHIQVKREEKIRDAALAQYGFKIGDYVRVDNPGSIHGINGKEGRIVGVEGAIEGMPAALAWIRIIIDGQRYASRANRLVKIKDATAGGLGEALAGKSEEDKDETQQQHDMATKKQKDRIDAYIAASKRRVDMVQKTQKKVPFSEAQNLFQEMVEGFIAKLQNEFARELPDATKYQEDTFGMDNYWFHDDRHVSVDGTLYEVLNYQTDYNFGADWAEDLRVAMKGIGYYMEADTAAEWHFVKESVQEGLRDKVLATGLAAAMAASPMAADAKTLIDPGHGGKDPGAVMGKTLEKDLVLPIAQKLKAALPGSWMTRDGDVAMGRSERAAAANEETGDVFISLHANSTEEPITTASGVEVLYWDGSVKGKALADALVTALGSKKEATPVTVGGRGETVLSKTKMPAVIIELGFLNNPDDLKNLKDPKWQDSFVEKTLQVLRQQGYENIK